MSNKGSCNSDNTISDPSSRDYAKKAKSKANEKSPYGDDEPSRRTDFK